MNCEGASITGTGSMDDRGSPMSWGAAATATLSRLESLSVPAL